MLYLLDIVRLEDNDVGGYSGTGTVWAATRGKSGCRGGQVRDWHQEV